MGYTTNFKGEFKFTAQPSAEAVLRLIDAAEDAPEGSPGGYCQWELTKGRTGLQWDGNEKFYDYVEWLQWILDTILKPEGIGLTGSVSYSGDDTTDNGVITIRDGIVKQLANALVGETLADLQAFKEFALKWDSDNEGDLTRAWSEHKGLVF